MVHRLPSQGASQRLEPYAGKPARTVLRGEWRSDALFLPDKPNGANGNGSGQPATEPVNDSATPAGGTPAPSDLDDDIPF